MPCCDFTPPAGVKRGTAEFSRLHRSHHATVATSDEEVPDVGDELLAVLVRLDHDEARLHELEHRNGITPPPLSRGAQAIIARQHLGPRRPT